MNEYTIEFDHHSGANRWRETVEADSREAAQLVAGLLAAMYNSVLRPDEGVVSAYLVE